MPDSVEQPPAVKERNQDALVRQAELIISNVLRGGVLLSAAVIALGVILFYAHYLTAGSPANAATTFPASLGEVGAGLAHGNPLAIIALGLLILLATPVFRVAVSIVAFVLERDRQYVVITLIVLAILLCSFFFLGPALDLLAHH